MSFKALINSKILRISGYIDQYCGLCKYCNKQDCGAYKEILTRNINSDGFIICYRLSSCITDEKKYSAKSLNNSMVSSEK